MSFLYVKAYHGPCDSFFNNIHKPQLLNGLRDRLQQLGFRIDLIPVSYSNYCMLEVCGHEVFRCNIKQLKFNTEYSRDLVCQKAVDAVLHASVKFRRARAYLWFWTLLDHQVFNRGKYGPIDHWPTPLTGKELASATECIKCCQILVKEREDNPLHLHCYFL